jgi:c-di-GMP-binding flagellar brake protein YcgR
VNTLYRSRIEICRLLEALAMNRSSLFVEFGTRTVELRILFVDPDDGCFVCSYGKNKRLNGKLFKEPSLKITSHLQEADLVFEVSNPTETEFDGQPAIRFALPNMLIRYHGRKAPRFSVASDISLRCIADTGGILPFEAHIVDISKDGLGGIIFDREVRLEPGAVLRHCRIIIPDGRAFIADLGVRYMTAITLPDGVLACRAGFRFIQTPSEIPELINFFNLDFTEGA